MPPVKVFRCFYLVLLFLYPFSCPMIVSFSNFCLLWRSLIFFGLLLWLHSFCFTHLSPLFILPASQVVATAVIIATEGNGEDAKRANRKGQDYFPAAQ